MINVLKLLEIRIKCGTLYKTFLALAHTKKTGAALHSSSIVKINHSLKYVWYLLST